MSGTEISGTIPEALTSLDNLEVLKIEDSYLSGTLPSLIRLRALKELTLAQNQLSGEIPASWSSWHSLESLYDLKLLHLIQCCRIPDF